MEAGGRGGPKEPGSHGGSINIDSINYKNIKCQPTNVIKRVKQLQWASNGRKMQCPLPIHNPNPNPQPIRPESTRSVADVRR